MRILVNPPPCFMSQVAYTGKTGKIRACATSKRNAKLVSMAPSQACGEIIHTDIEKTEHNNPLLLAICASYFHRSNIISYETNICGLVAFWEIHHNAWAMRSSLYNTTRRILIRVMSGNRFAIGSCSSVSSTCYKNGRFPCHDSFDVFTPTFGRYDQLERDAQKGVKAVPFTV